MKRRKNMKSARETALLILYRFDKEKAYLNIAFKNLISEENYSKEDTAFIKELVFGVVKYKITLDYVISTFSKLKLKKISPYIINILRLGAYQLLYMNKIPESAAVNESVKLAKKYGHSASVSFANAILRKISKMDEITYQGEDKVKYLSIKYSHPEDLVLFFIKTFGEEKTEKILSANVETPPLCIRVNERFLDREKLKEMLLLENIKASDAPVSETALFVNASGDITKSKAYKDGYFTIQDQASQLVGKMLNPKPDDVVLDMCSAPGGKTTHIAELMENKGEIIAFDLYEKRLSDVAAAAKRLKTDIIKTEAADASVFMPQFENYADKILLDVPCSGMGIIRRKPDIKYKEDLLNFEQLVKVQKNILNICSKYLKIDGIMIYSTCTINPEENMGVVEEFLKTHPNFKIDDNMDDVKLSQKASAVLEKGYGTFFPGESDGFFICRLRRVN